MATAQRRVSAMAARRARCTEERVPHHGQAAATGRSALGRRCPCRWSGLASMGSQPASWAGCRSAAPGSSPSSRPRSNGSRPSCCAKRAVAIAKDTRIADFLAQDLERLSASLPEYANTMKLREKLEHASARQADLDAQNARLRRQLAEAQHMLGQHATGVGPIRSRSITATRQGHPGDRSLKENHLCVVAATAICPATGMPWRRQAAILRTTTALWRIGRTLDAVLCRGRSGHLPNRLHQPQRLLARQGFCQRTGKQCVFVENPSTSLLTRKLQTNRRR